MKVSWFSAGVSSAVATKLSNPDVIIYIHIDDQHPDTLRFVYDCEKWFGKKIIRLQSELKTVEMACRKAGTLPMRMFSPCTKFLKKEPRKNWEKQNPGRHTYVWGFDSGEKHRIDRIVEGMTDYDHEFPLRDLTKEECHGIMYKTGIKRPAMYDLGYSNNNCLGCLRGRMGYFNKIRKDFPEVFASRVRLEKIFTSAGFEGEHARIIKDYPLDKLPEGKGRCEPILDECGIYCEIVTHGFNNPIPAPEGWNREKEENGEKQ
jgi:hypothetical protein